MHCSSLERFRDLHLSSRQLEGKASTLHQSPYLPLLLGSCIEFYRTLRFHSVFISNFDLCSIECISIKDLRKTKAAQILCMVSGFQPLSFSKYFEVCTGPQYLTYHLFQISTKSLQGAQMASFA